MGEDSQNIPNDLLKFGLGNAKLADNVATFTLPAGRTCPGAVECKAHFDRDKRKLIDGPKQKHRCFMASTEAARPTVRALTDWNMQLLLAAKTKNNMAALIKASLPSSRKLRHVRVHVGGDYFSAEYARAWLKVARDTPHLNFYSYTTSANFFVANMHEIPDNFTFVASRGGKHDKLIEQYDLRNSVVVYHPEQAEALGLEIDHDDSLAMNSSVKQFALLIHGMQPAGSAPAAAIKRLKTENITYSYSK
jgi:hypothetical protein